MITQTIPARWFEGDTFNVEIEPKKSIRIHGTEDTGTPGAEIFDTTFEKNSNHPGRLSQRQPRAGKTPTQIK